MKTVLLIILLVISGMIWVKGDAFATDVPEITPEEAFKHLNEKGYIFLDVREPHEFSEERIPGAINLPKGQIESKIKELFPNNEAQTLIVYCRSGVRSLSATKSLIGMGYKALNMKGGIIAWKKANLPTEK